VKKFAINWRPHRIIAVGKFQEGSLCIPGNLKQANGKRLSHVRRFITAFSAQPNSTD
jgi:hypothetical protein